MSDALTPILIAHQELPCIHQQCVSPITPGDPVVLMEAGWTHALHLTEETA